MADGAIGEDRNVRGASANVDQGHAELALVFGQHRQAACQGVEHELLDLKATAAHAFDDVFGRALSACDDVHLGLKPDAAHANRLAHVLVVNDEFLGLHQQDALVVGDIDRPGGLDHPCHISGTHLAVLDGHHAAGVHAPDMAAGDAGVDPGDLAVGHQLGFLERLLNALHGGIDVHHHTALEAVARSHAQTSELELAVGQHLGHHHHHLGSADVQADDQIFVFFCHRGTFRLSLSLLLAFFGVLRQRGDAAQTQGITVFVPQVGRLQRLGLAAVAPADRRQGLEKTLHPELHLRHRASANLDHRAGVKPGLPTAPPIELELL